MHRAVFQKTNLIWDVQVKCKSLIMGSKHICHLLWNKTPSPTSVYYWKLNWKWKSLSCVWLFATPCTIQSMEFSRQNTGVGSHSLQWIFPTQGSNPGLLHCRQFLYWLSHKESPCPLLNMSKKLLWQKGSASPCKQYRNMRNL